MRIKAVIMAGGKGTRINSVVSDIPKPMIDICGKPLLERQMEWLISQNIKEVTLIIGHLGEKIVEYFENGEKVGISIKYIIENEPLGTAGGLYYTRTEEQCPILLINGDLMLDVDIEKMYDFHKNNQADITLLTHPNNHPYDSALIETNDYGRILRWINKEDPREDYKNRVNAGVHLIEQNVLDFMNTMMSPKKLDLDRDILKPNIGNYKIYAYDTPEYVKDIGTPERYHSVCLDYMKGLIKRKNLSNKQKAIFLDRDGTINKLKGFITTPDEIELIEGSAKAIALINQSGYLAIVITNQPVIARGDCSFEDLEQIHKRLQRLLGEEHAYLDDVFICPHHTDKGYEGERPEYKIDCECRKPKPGLLYQAMVKYNVNIEESFMIGDSKSDIEAGRNAGCRTGYVISKEAANQAKINADIIGDNLNEIVGRILNDYN